MKSRTILVLLALVLTAFGGWYVGRHGHGSAATSATGERRILFYQSAMHPHIKSDKPGNCTICGMKLTPVYEGQEGAVAADASTVRLSPTSVNVLNVQTAQASKRPIQRTIRVAGTIDDDETRHRRLSAYVDGRVDELGVRYVGAEVKKGDLLAKIYSPALLAARDEYLLLHSQPASPQRERLLKATGEKLARMGLGAEQIAALPTVKNPPDHLEILAPMTGTVVTRGVYEGQYVKEGDVLFEIGDFSQMWFVFDAYERDLTWIAPGQQVEVASPAVPGKTFKAPITFVDPNLNPATRSAKVRVVLDNPLVGEPGKQRRELLHKFYGTGVIQVETPAVLTIPRSAVLSPGGNPVAYVAHSDGGYEPRRLKLGRAGDELWEVLDGVGEGELVVTTGNLLIDAQAQLDHGDAVLMPIATTAPTAGSHPFTAPLNGAQQAAAKDLFKAADDLSRVLAADDLPGFNGKVDALHAVIAKVASAFGPAADWVTSTGHLPTSPDLPAARKDYYPFSKALAEFAHALRMHDASFSDVRIFECPMVKDAVPNAPERKGRWVQLTAELKNPFFGAEMLECGVEVKP